MNTPLFPSLPYYTTKNSLSLYFKKACDKTVMEITHNKGFHPILFSGVMGSKICVYGSFVIKYHWGGGFVS